MGYGYCFESECEIFSHLQKACSRGTQQCDIISFLVYLSGFFLFLTFLPLFLDIFKPSNNVISRRMRSTAETNLGLNLSSKWSKNNFFDPHLFFSPLGGKVTIFTESHVYLVVNVVIILDGA